MLIQTSLSGRGRGGLGLEQSEDFLGSVILYAFAKEMDGMEGLQGEKEDEEEEEGCYDKGAGKDVIAEINGASNEDTEL